MRTLLPTVEGWMDEGLAVSRAVVIRTFGSSPRRAGAAMVRAEDGRLAGSVSGGCIEGATAELMAAAQATGLQRVVRFGVSDEDAWDVGLACGGTIDVLVQPEIPGRVMAAARSSVADDGWGSAVVTELPPGSPSPTPSGTESGPEALPPELIVVGEDGRLDGTTGIPDGDRLIAEHAMACVTTGTSSLKQIEGRQFFVESFAVRPRLVVVGAGEVAAHLVILAHALDYETVVIDGRAAFLTPERFPLADSLRLGWPDEVAPEIRLGSRDAVAVLSHDPKFDEPAIEDALARGCRYVGAIGSRGTQRARRQRLSERGVSSSDLGRLRGPIGLDLGGRDPAETALSIMAEVVAERHGASGGSMRPAKEDRG